MKETRIDIENLQNTCYDYLTQGTGYLIIIQTYKL